MHCVNAFRGSVFTDFRVLEDSITMVKLNLFRPLAHDRPPMDEAMEEDMYSDPQWPHLLVVYQFYLDLVRYMCCGTSPVSAASHVSVAVVLPLPSRRRCRMILT